MKFISKLDDAQHAWKVPMAQATKIPGSARNLQRLRRFLLLLTNDHPECGKILHESLCELKTGSLRPSHGTDEKITLYRTVVKRFAEQMKALDQADSVADHRRNAALASLSQLTPTARLAFLLKSFEQFSEQDAASILDVDAAEFATQYAAALREIAELTCTDVLIVEDENLTPLGLSRIVTGMGHAIAGTTSSATTAAEWLLGSPPLFEVGLVLASVQADGGSPGRHQLEQNARNRNVPIIFIIDGSEGERRVGRPRGVYVIERPCTDLEISAAVTEAMFFR